MKREVEGEKESAWPAVVAFLLCILIILAVGAGLYQSLHKCPDRPPCKRQHEVLSPQPTIELSPEFLRRIERMEWRLDDLQLHNLGIGPLQKYCIERTGEISVLGRAGATVVEVEGWRVPCGDGK